ncbi:MAG TPA: hypothetical protein VF171_00835 [Trueperaceae bacterium]
MMTDPDLEEGMNEDLRTADTRQPASPQDPTPQAKRKSTSTHREWDMPWLGGAALTIIGMIFLTQNLTGRSFGNWWALFIAIPGILALGTAWQRYQHKGEKLDRKVLGTAMGAVFPLLVAAIFLLELDWGKVWPLFLIAGGLAALVTRSAPEK